ncbi:MAG: hypothetical protein MHM6MM_002419 [Cercozoa sp. M6MM]
MRRLLVQREPVLTEQQRLGEYHERAARKWNIDSDRAAQTANAGFNQLHELAEQLDHPGQEFHQKIDTMITDFTKRLDELREKVRMSVVANTQRMVDFIIDQWTQDLQQWQNDARTAQEALYEELEQALQAQEEHKSARFPVVRDLGPELREGPPAGTGAVPWEPTSRHARETRPAELERERLDREKLELAEDMAAFDARMRTELETHAARLPATPIEQVTPEAAVPWLPAAPRKPPQTTQRPPTLEVGTPEFAPRLSLTPSTITTEGEVPPAATGTPTTATSTPESSPASFPGAPSAFERLTESPLPSEEEETWKYEEEEWPVEQEERELARAEKDQLDLTLRTCYGEVVVAYDKARARTQRAVEGLAGMPRLLPEEEVAHVEQQLQQLQQQVERSFEGLKREQEAQLLDLLRQIQQAQTQDDTQRLRALADNMCRAAEFKVHQLEDNLRAATEDFRQNLQRLIEAARQRELAEQAALRRQVEQLRQKQLQGPTPARAAEELARAEAELAAFDAEQAHRAAEAEAIEAAAVRAEEIQQEMAKTIATEAETRAELEQEQRLAAATFGQIQAQRGLLEREQRAEQVQRKQKQLQFLLRQEEERKQAEEERAARLRGLLQPPTPPVAPQAPEAPELAPTGAPVAAYPTLVRDVSVKMEEATTPRTTEGPAGPPAVPVAEPVVPAPVAETPAVPATGVPSPEKQAEIEDIMRQLVVNFILQLSKDEHLM